MTMLTSTIAWCTPCVERARRAHSFTLDVVSHLVAQDLSLAISHLHSHPWAHFLDSPLPFYFYLFFPVFSFYLLHSELYPELDNLIVMESLCYSSDDAYDVSTSLKGYEPKFVTFGELNDSSGPFSYITQSSDQDMDDVTLGKLLTEAHRGQADYCGPEGMSVSQSSLSVVFDRTGKPVGENSSNAQLRTLLDEQRQMIIAEYFEKIGHHESKQLMPKKNAEFYEKNYGASKWIFVKFINKVLQ